MKDCHMQHIIYNIRSHLYLLPVVAMFCTRKLNYCYKGTSLLQMWLNYSIFPQNERFDQRVEYTIHGKMYIGSKKNT